MIHHKFPLSLFLVLIMAGCIQPTPGPTPTPPPPIPDPTPEPTPEPINTVIVIEGPDTVLSNQTATLYVKGLSSDQLQKGKVVWWPRNHVEVLPVQTWGGQPLLMVRSPVNETYLVQVMTVINNELAYAEHTLTVGTPPGPQPDPPGPTPDPPGPEPDPIPPPPDPIFEEPFTILLIEETADRTTDEAAAVLSQEIIKLARDRGWTRYLLDKDIKDKDGKTPESVKPYIDRAVGKGLPWYIVVDKNGKIVVEGKITEEEELLKKLQAL